MAFLQFIIGKPGEGTDDRQRPMGRGCLGL